MQVNRGAAADARSAIQVSDVSGCFLLRCNGRGARAGALARRGGGRSKEMGRRRVTSYTRGRGWGGGAGGCTLPPLLLLPPPYTICWPGHRQLRGMVRPWTSTEVGTMQWPMLVVQLLAAGGRERGQRGKAVSRRRKRHDGEQAAACEKGAVSSSAGHCRTSVHMLTPSAKLSAAQLTEPELPAPTFTHRRGPTGGRSGSAAGPCRWPGPGW